jgi:ankyrin repeat protein
MALLTLLLATLGSCDQNYFNAQYFRSTEYYFPDGDFREFAVAAATGKTDVLERLTTEKKVEVDQRGTEGLTALAWALGAKNLAGVDWLLSHGANPDRAVYGDTTMLTLAIYQNDLALVNRLFKSGAAPDHEVNWNRSPLGRAVTIASPEIVEALLENGANPNGIEGEEGRPLVYSLENSRYAVAVLLLKRKADPRYLEGMEAWIIGWMEGAREKYGKDVDYLAVRELLVAAGVKLL